jgi:alkylated DNA repair dioxygenase AlkB
MPSFLFGDGPQRLLDDASGRIEHHPDFLPVQDAADWFEVLHASIPWRAERRLMYERELDVPRLLASYRLADPGLPSLLGEAAWRVGAALGTEFNSVGLNLYRDQHDSVAMHNDRLGDLVEGQPIALVSLGATRRMHIRAKRPPRRQLQVDLAAGSLLVMDYATQLNYDHGIPKEKILLGPRISLAFRVRRLRD